MIDCNAIIKRIVPAALLVLPLLSVSSVGDDPVTRCAQTEDADERISCLENALRQIDRPAEDNAQHDRGLVASGEESRTSPVTETVAPDRVERHEVEREQFGLQPKPDAADTVTAIDVTIVAITRNAYGKSIYTTTSGQVWQQTDQKTLRLGQLPVAATIRNGTAGSFFLRAKEGGVAVRVKRRK